MKGIWTLTLPRYIVIKTGYNKFPYTMKHSKVNMKFQCQMHCKECYSCGEVDNYLPRTCF